MVTIKDIDIKIRELTGEDKKARPFLCEGSPIDCEVFLIGHNPAVSTFFWDYWDTQYGCHKSKWIEKYRQENLQPGKRTRENIEKLIEEITEYKVLDTNIYHKRSPNMPELPKGDRNTEVCDYLIEAINPKLIFVHGAKAIKHLEELAKLGKGTLTKYIDKFIDVELFKKKTAIYTGHHHLCNWSHKKIQKVGNDLLKWCKENALSTYGK